MEEKKHVDATVLKDGDVVEYLNYDQGKFLVDRGVVKGDNIYNDGVDVRGEGWRQYVSKWFIVRVTRGEEVVFESEDYRELMSEEEAGDAVGGAV